MVHLKHNMKKMIIKYCFFKKNYFMYNKLYVQKYKFIKMVEDLCYMYMFIHTLKTFESIKKNNNKTCFFDFDSN